LQHAADAAVTGDTVIALAGTYNVGSTVEIRFGASLRGAAGPRPVIRATGMTDALSVEDGTVEHLEIRGGHPRTLLLTDATAADLVVVSTVPGAPAVLMQGSNSFLRDSLARTTGGEASGVYVSGTGDGAARIRNVTTATASDSYGIRVVAFGLSDGGGCVEVDSRATLENVIARGTLDDLRAEGFGSELGYCGSPEAQVTASYSNFRAATNFGSASPLAQGPGNQRSAAQTDDDAIFADTSYRQLLTAPTHNAGLADPSDNGRVDPDGHPRVGDGRVDIGADELPSPPSVSTGGAKAITANSADLTGLVDGRGEPVAAAFEYGTTPALGFMTAELPAGSTSLTMVRRTLTGLPPSETIYYRIHARLTGVQERNAVGDTSSFTTLSGAAPVVNLKVSDLAVKPKRFRVGSELPEVAAVGTTIRFGLSEDARVTLKFFRKVRRRHGGKRFVRKGKFTYGAQAGDQRIAFEGRLSERKKLRPGRYKLVVRAKHVSGTKSKRATARFRLLRKR
jgi:hypothetical protein